MARPGRVLMAALAALLLALLLFALFGSDAPLAQRMIVTTRTIALGGFLLILALLSVGLAVRAIGAIVQEPLKPWHTHVPPEPTAREIDRMDWTQWLAREEAVFTDVRQVVCERLPAEDRVAENRYWQGSPLHPAGFKQDFNRSYTLMPEGKPRGAVVLLHGLTDSPYSLRHLGAMAQARGHAVVAIRSPGHGTVPGGLVRARRSQWKAAARLALREAARLAGPGKPVSIIGYSQGAALALDCTFRALKAPAMPIPARLILISPMIGITEFARLAGVAALPAIIPAFSRAAWMSVLPEFNPFKYNSFPANAAVQGHLLTRDIQALIDAAERDSSLARLPPVMAFQPVMDSTVSAEAVVDRFMNRLAPSAGPLPHELLLFDINRASNVGPLKRSVADTALQELIDGAPHGYRRTIVANAAPGSTATVLRQTEPGTTDETVTPLGIDYPRNIFSLSHIALPFPMDDSLYGIEPDEAEDAAEFGARLGNLAVRGEKGVLSVETSQFARLSCNPFFPWLARRVMEALP